MVGIGVPARSDLHRLQPEGNNFLDHLLQGHVFVNGIKDPNRNLLVLGVGLGFDRATCVTQCVRFRAAADGCCCHGCPRDTEKVATTDRRRILLSHFVAPPTISRACLQKKIPASLRESVIILTAPRNRTRTGSPTGKLANGRVTQSVQPSVTLDTISSRSENCRTFLVVPWSSTSPASRPVSRPRARFSRRQSTLGRREKNEQSYEIDPCRITRPVLCGSRHSSASE